MDDDDLRNAGSQTYIKRFIDIIDGIDPSGSDSETESVGSENDDSDNDEKEKEKIGDKDVTFNPLNEINVKNPQSEGNDTILFNYFLLFFVFNF